MAMWEYNIANMYPVAVYRVYTAVPTTIGKYDELTQSTAINSSTTSSQHPGNIPQAKHPWLECHGIGNQAANVAAQARDRGGSPQTTDVPG